MFNNFSNDFIKCVERINVNNNIDNNSNNPNNGVSHLINSWNSEIHQIDQFNLEQQLAVGYTNSLDMMFCNNKLNNNNNNGSSGSGSGNDGGSCLSLGNYENEMAGKIINSSQMMLFGRNDDLSNDTNDNQFKYNLFNEDANKSKLKLNKKKCVVASVHYDLNDGYQVNDFKVDNHEIVDDCDDVDVDEVDVDDGEDCDDQDNQRNNINIHVDDNDDEIIQHSNKIADLNNRQVLFNHNNSFDRFNSIQNEPLTASVRSIDETSLLANNQTCLTSFGSLNLEAHLNLVRYSYFNNNNQKEYGQSTCQNLNQAESSLSSSLNVEDQKCLNVDCHLTSVISCLCSSSSSTVSSSSIINASGSGCGDQCKLVLANNTTQQSLDINDELSQTNNNKKLKDTKEKKTLECKCSLENSLVEIATETTAAAVGVETEKLVAKNIEAGQIEDNKDENLSPPSPPPPPTFQNNKKLIKNLNGNLNRKLNTKGSSNLSKKNSNNVRLMENVNLSSSSECLSSSDEGYFGSYSDKNKSTLSKFICKDDEENKTTTMKTTTTHCDKHPIKRNNHQSQLSMQKSNEEEKETNDEDHQINHLETFDSQLDQENNNHLKYSDPTTFDLLNQILSSKENLVLLQCLLQNKNLFNSGQYYKDSIELDTNLDDDFFTLNKSNNEETNQIKTDLEEEKDVQLMNLSLNIFNTNNIETNRENDFINLLETNKSIDYDYCFSSFETNISTNNKEQQQPEDVNILDVAKLLLDNNKYNERIINNNDLSNYASCDSNYDLNNNENDDKKSSSSIDCCSCCCCCHLDCCMSKELLEVINETNRERIEREQLEDLEMRINWRELLNRRSRLERIQREQSVEDHTDLRAYLNEIEMNYDYYESEKDTIKQTLNLDYSQQALTCDIDTMLKFVTNKKAFNLRENHRLVETERQLKNMKYSIKSNQMMKMFANIHVDSIPEFFPIPSVVPVPPAVVQSTNKQVYNEYDENEDLTTTTDFEFEFYNEQQTNEYDTTYVEQQDETYNLGLDDGGGYQMTDDNDYTMIEGVLVDEYEETAEVEDQIELIGNEMDSESTKLNAEYDSTESSTSNNNNNPVIMIDDYYNSNVGDSDSQLGGTEYYNEFDGEYYYENEEDYEDYEDQVLIDNLTHEEALELLKTESELYALQMAQASKSGILNKTSGDGSSKSQSRKNKRYNSGASTVSTTLSEQPASEMSNGTNKLATNMDIFENVFNYEEIESSIIAGADYSEIKSIETTFPKTFIQNAAASAALGSSTNSNISMSLRNSLLKLRKTRRHLAVLIEMNSKKLNNGSNSSSTASSLSTSNNMSSSTKQINIQQQQQQSSSSRKPCVYMLNEGRCMRADCRFAHDLKTITCKYWLDGECLKGDACEFLHDIIDEPQPSNLNNHKSSLSSSYGSGSIGSHKSHKHFRSLDKNSNGSSSSNLSKPDFKLDSEEFPALGGNGGGGGVKTCVIQTKSPNKKETTNVKTTTNVAAVVKQQAVPIKTAASVLLSNVASTSSPSTTTSTAVNIVQNKSQRSSQQQQQSNSKKKSSTTPATNAGSKKQDKSSTNSTTSASNKSKENLSISSSIQTTTSNKQQQPKVNSRKSRDQQAKSTKSTTKNQTSTTTAQSANQKLVAVSQLSTQSAANIIPIKIKTANIISKSNANNSCGSSSSSSSSSCGSNSRGNSIIRTKKLLNVQ